MSLEKMEKELNDYKEFLGMMADEAKADDRRAERRDNIVGVAITAAVTVAFVAGAIFGQCEAGQWLAAAAVSAWLTFVQAISL